MKKHKIDEVLNMLYRKHTSWLMMAQRLTPVSGYAITAEDVVQDVYLKILKELRDKKLDYATIIIEGQPNYGVMYLRIRNIIANKMRLERPTVQLNRDIEDSQFQSASEFFESIDNVIEGFNWFHKKLFKLYSKEFRSLRKLSNATKISYKVVCKTVKECKEEIKKQVNGK